MTTPSESRLFVWANGNFLTVMSCFFAGGNLLTNFGGGGGGGGSGYETFVTLSLVFSIPVSAGEQGQGARKGGGGPGLPQFLEQQQKECLSTKKKTRAFCA